MIRKFSTPIVICNNSDTPGSDLLKATDKETREMKVNIEKKNNKHNVILLHTHENNYN